MQPDLKLTLMPRLKARALRQAHPEDIQSFYHLKDGDLHDPCCCGTACFAGRHLNPARWQQAVSSPTRLYCLGKCYAGPAAFTDAARPSMAVHSRASIILERIVSGGARSLEAYVESGGYRALRRARRMPRDEVIRMVETSQLRGRGGAAFPTGTKWRAAFEQTSTDKYIVANADEGDPGAYIDRFILEDDPHALIEGMAIAGYAIGALKGWVYLRREYPQARSIFQHAIDQCRSAGLLRHGNSRSFDIELCSGFGSYLCGEETALLNSIEGKRPVARSRPPYATQMGLCGMPTVINNVETFSNIPWIIRHGGEAYRSLGFSASRGTKVVCLNSLFNRPGLYEIEFGMSVRQIVQEIGGGLKSGDLMGVMIGGPLAGLIPSSRLDTQLGFEELHAIGASVGHGGIIAFDNSTTIPELVHHVFSFAAFESCGQCVPCRLGTRHIEKLSEQILSAGAVAAQRRREWDDIIAALKLTSLCGLGSGVAEFAESISRHYGKELAACFK